MGDVTRAQATRTAIVALLASLAVGACARPETGSVDGDTVASSGEVSTGGTAGAVAALADSGALVGAGATDLATLGPADVMAILGAANSGEITTSRVALTRATGRDVRAYARRMIDAHQALQTEADALAARLEVTPGDPAPAVDRTRAADEMRRQLDSAAAGPSWDRQYLDGQLQAHQQMLAELRAMQRTGHAELRTLIRRAIPAVEAHLRETQQLLARPATAGKPSTRPAGGR